MEKTLKITGEEAKALYKNCSDEFKKVLESNFGKEFFSEKLRDRMTTKEDLARELKARDIQLPYLNPKNKRERKLNAEVMIECMTEFLNDGTVLDWTDTNERKHYPYFEKTKNGWVVGAVSVACYAALLGSGCYFKNYEDAKHIANHFLDIYIDYLPE